MPDVPWPEVGWWSSDQAGWVIGSLPDTDDPAVALAGQFAFVGYPTRIGCPGSVGGRIREVVRCRADGGVLTVITRLDDGLGDGLGVGYGHLTANGSGVLGLTGMVDVPVDCCSVPLRKAVNR